MARQGEKPLVKKRPAVALQEKPNQCQQATPEFFPLITLMQGFTQPIVFSSCCKDLSVAATVLLTCINVIQMM